MNDMTDFPENLVARARRAALLPGEQAELERVLATSPTLRTAYRLGRDFDEIAAVQAGDEQRVEGFVDRALAARRPRRARSFAMGRLTPWLAAAAVLAVCGVALGVRGVWWPRLVPGSVVSSSLPDSAAARRKAKVTPVGRVVSQPLGEPSAETTPIFPTVTTQENAVGSTNSRSKTVGQEAPVTSARETHSAPPVAPALTAVNGSEHKDSVVTIPLESPSEIDPGTLLRQANRARSLGENSRAIVLLTELQDRFPTSAQAHVALVSLGKLMMQQGTPEAALQRFSSYLATSGPLEEEALFGRAQALAALGRAPDEIRTWKRLLLRFPSSVYAGAARTRLDALGGDSVQ